MSDESKAANKAEQKAEKAATAANFELTLDEFCQQESASAGASPELIAGFYHEQKTAGTVKSTSAAFADALDRFAKQPA